MNGPWSTTTNNEQYCSFSLNQDQISFLIRAVTSVISLQGSRVVLSDAVDECICFTRKIQHGFLMTVRPLS